MTTDNYEGTDPNKEIHLEWRHQKLNYLKRMIDTLDYNGKQQVLEYLQKVMR